VVFAGAERLVSAEVRGQADQAERERRHKDVLPIRNRTARDRHSPQTMRARSSASGSWMTFIQKIDGECADPVGGAAR